MRLEADLGLPSKDLADALSVDRKTLDRWVTGETYPQREARRRLVELLALSQRLCEAFEGPDGVQEWLHASSRYLGGLTPAEALRSGASIGSRRRSRFWNLGSSSSRQVLFICTGNYYRSRFAELLFNAGAQARGLPWRATLGAPTSTLPGGNVGPISVRAREALEALGVPLDPDLRLPLPLTEEDLAAADHIVAVCEAEHRPHLERDFPAAAASVEYWGVEDLGVTPAEDALPALERHVADLLDRLSRLT